MPNEEIATIAMSRATISAELAVPPFRSLLHNPVLPLTYWSLLSTQLPVPDPAQIRVHIDMVSLKTSKIVGLLGK